ncbi:MAG: hypothetical protein M0D53_09795 [Flavobacterium sp. JAD_PAG50586_2]|nr:MAG: hypothetical protein M0D53_09795 [Flavobacterium sp. JAD_PAG50586_2]
MRKSVLALFVFLLPLILLSQSNERNLSTEHWQFRKQGDSNWLEAKVPGTVHTDLFQNKIITNPFFGANEKQLQWIENEDWQYQTTFKISEKELKSENCFMQFEGLDTYSEVLLNGKKFSLPTICSEPGKLM